MAYSIVDPNTDFDLVRFPVSAEAALFIELSFRCRAIPDTNLFSKLYDLYMFSGCDVTEDMICFAIRQGIKFDCPVCGGSKRRQYWETFAGDITLKVTLCYCTRNY